MHTLVSEADLYAFVSERADLRVVVDISDDDSQQFAVVEYQGNKAWQTVALLTPEATTTFLEAYNGTRWTFGVYPQSAALPGSLPNTLEELAFSYEADAEALLSNH